MKGKTHDLNHDLTFFAHTINCVCHSIRSMFRVLGIYNFASRIKCVIAIVFILSFIYDIPVMFHFKWETINGKIEVVQTELIEDGMYLQISAWVSFAFRFLIPTLCLAIFSVLTVLQVNSFDSYIFLRIQSLIVLTNNLWFSWAFFDQELCTH